MSEALNSSRILDVTVRRRMPYPVAAAWHRVAFAITPADRLDRVLDCYSSLLRTAAVFILPDYLRGPRDEQVEGLLAKLARPSDGHWMAIVRALVTAVRDRPAPPPFVPEAAEWLYDGRGKPTTAATALDALIALRNEIRHGAAAASAAVIEERLERAIDLSRRLLATAKWLAGYRPLRILEQTTTSRRNRFKGYVQFFVGSRELSEPEPAEWSAWLLDDRVYLASPDGAALLDLYPFLQVLPDPESKRELPMLFKSAPKLRSVRLENAATGRERDLGIRGDQGELSFETWLARRGDREVVSDNARAASELASEVALDRAGRLIAERYEVLDVLGAGGMATVYRVWDREFQAGFALKVLDADFSADEGFRRRFRREARIMAKIQHPNVLGVTDVGQLDDGCLFLKMPIAQGGSLQDFVGGDVPEQTVHAWLTQALSALAHLDEHGIVHRDIKPGNLLIDDDTTLLVSDFGIALTTDEKRLTLTMDRLGSLAYMAPEQRLSSTVDGRADVYSLALSFHELITGNRPEREVGAGLGGALGEAIRRMGKSDPAERPSAAEVLVDLGAVDPGLVRSKPDWEPKPSQRRSQPPHDGVQPLREAGSSASHEPEPAIQPTPPDTLLRRSSPVARIAFVAVLIAAVVAAAFLWTRVEDDEQTAATTDATTDGEPPDLVVVVPPPQILVRAADQMTVHRIEGAELMLGLTPEEVDEHREACARAGSHRCDQDDYFDRETPAVPVSVDTFFIDRHEVTRAQWEACVQAGACAPVDETQCSIYNGSDWALGSEDGRELPPESRRPLVPRTCVTRDDAETYCAWVGARLPTEAEWELAAGGREGSIYAWGRNITPQHAAYIDDGENTLVQPEDRRAGATPEGVLHLSGNAYEWVADDYCRYTEHPGGHNPICRSERGSRGVSRGGSFISSPSSLRTTYRRSIRVNERHDNLGFRCAASNPPEPAE